MSKALKIATATALLAITIIIIFFICSIMGYFTASEESTSTFTVGEVTIGINQVEHDPKETKTLIPGQVVDENPSVENTGKNSAYVFMEVIVPKKDVVTYTMSAGIGVRQPSAVTQLFTFNNVSSNWYLMNTDTSGLESNVYRYVYGTSSKCTKLNANSSTSALFQSVTYANVVEGQLTEETIGIKAYAIQSDNIKDTKTDNPSEVWSVLSKQSE